MRKAADILKSKHLPQRIMVLAVFFCVLFLGGGYEFYKINQAVKIQQQQDLRNLYSDLLHNLQRGKFNTQMARARYHQVGLVKQALEEPFVVRVQPIGFIDAVEKIGLKPKVNMLRVEFSGQGHENKWQAISSDQLRQQLMALEQKRVDIAKQIDEFSQVIIAYQLETNEVFSAQQLVKINQSRLQDGTITSGLSREEAFVIATELSKNEQVMQLIPVLDQAHKQMAQLLEKDLSYAYDIVSLVADTLDIQHYPRPPRRHWIAANS